MGLQEKPPCCLHLFSHVAIFCSLVTNFWPSTVSHKFYSTYTLFGHSTFCTTYCLQASIFEETTFMLEFLLVCYIAKEAKRSIWHIYITYIYIWVYDINVSMYIQWRPTDRLFIWKIQMALSPQQIIRFTPCLVPGWGFRGRLIKWCYFQFDQIKMAARPPSWKIQIMIYLQWIIWSTSCLVVGQGFRSRRFECHYFQLDQTQ